jgi:hypothetical protein
MSDRDINVQQLLDHLYRGSGIGRDATVKVSTQKMPELTPAAEIEPAAHCATQSAAGPPAAESTAEPMIAGSAPKQPAPSSTVATVQGHPKASSRIALALSVVVVGLTAVNALNNTAMPDRPTASPTTSLQKTEQQERSAMTADEEGEPVLVANPFDEAEIFEFPPGTSEGEARDAVADMLLKRAMERQAQLSR